VKQIQKSKLDIHDIHRFFIKKSHYEEVNLMIS